MISKALNVVALPSIISLSWNVPWVTNIVIVLPAFPTTVPSASEVIPLRTSPTLGKIPDALVTVTILVAICCTVTSTYLTAATEFGGSLNTIESFKLAFEAGLQGVELDVQITQDKKLIVFHDWEIINKIYL